MEVQKTIIITLPSAGNKIPIVPHHKSFFTPETTLLTNNQQTEKSRKRKLETLSTEEKILRKKMKNRIAAQNSRDKKKAKMDELEGLLKEISRQNFEIMGECRRLKEENAILRRENKELRRSSANTISPSVVKIKEEPCLDSITSLKTQEGPAVSNPLQKGREFRLVMAWQILCLAWGLLIWKLMFESQETLMDQIVESPISLTPKCSMDELMERRKWWGAHQRTWNPVKIEPAALISNV